MQNPKTNKYSDLNDLKVIKFSNQFMTRKISLIVLQILDNKAKFLPQMLLYKKVNNYFYKYKAEYIDGCIIIIIGYVYLYVIIK